MKLNKALYTLLLLMCFCCMLLSGCGENVEHSTTSNAHTPTPAATKAKTTSATLPADCPAAGSFRSVQLPSDMGPAQPAVFYLTFWGGVQSGLNPLDLKRYDLTTGKTSTMTSFAGTVVGARPVIQLSPNKHWLLVTSYSRDVSRVQLMNTGGTRIHTIACYPSNNNGLESADWLPDGQQIALTSLQSDQQQKVYTYVIKVLNLATGKVRTVLAGNYYPYTWLDDHRLIVEKTDGANDATLAFFLFDTNKGSIRKPGDLTRIVTLPAWGNFAYGDVAASSDSSQLFISSFAQTTTNPANCQGAVSKGPGTLYSYTINGGATHTIYSSKSLAILKVQPVDARTLLIYIENTGGDLSQNGLWKINTDGTGLTRLTTAHDSECNDLNHQILLPQIVSNSQSYALEQVDARENPSIEVGSLSGGAPIIIETGEDVMRSPGARFDPYLQLVGMA